MFLLGKSKETTENNTETTEIEQQLNKTTEQKLADVEYKLAILWNLLTSDGKQSRILNSFGKKVKKKW